MSVRLDISGVPESLRPGIEDLAEVLPFTIAPGGVLLRVALREGDSVASFDGSIAEIACAGASRFFRAFGLLVGHMASGRTFRVTESPRFRSLGAMLDCSRNAVMTPRAVGMLTRRLALMGYDTLMLYTEDTYEVEGEPYFGYLRGRYTQAETRAIDEAAALYGIELVPCIQTLAHIEQYLRWDAAEPHRDTGDILLVGQEATYELIERMLRSASAPVRSRRIHLGMDEAHQLGLGRYLDRNGYTRKAEIMRAHLGRVCAIAERLGLAPMIWGDMFFREAIPGGGYYDAGVRIPPEAMRGVPEKLSLVYWDYYHDDEAFYATYIRKYQELGRPLVFAGGLYTYAGMFPNYEKSFRTATAALKACKANGVRDVILTVWNDNGAECNHFADLLGLQLYAEHAYHDAPSLEDVSSRFAACTGADASDFLALGSLDNLPGVPQGGLEWSNPSRYLLWQDPLLGLFDEHVRGIPTDRHYGELAGRMEAARQRYAGRPELERLFLAASALCRVLELKGSLGIRLRDAYTAGDREALGGAASALLPEIERRVEHLHERHRDLWMGTNKPQGWEVTDIRYGGLRARLETARRRLAAFTAGEIPVLEELAEPRLRFDGLDPGSASRPGHFNLYHRIAAPGAFM